MKIQSVTAAVAVAFLAALVFAPSTHAATEKSKKSDDSPVKTTVVVREGDTLTSIADAHDTDYVRIFNANESLVSPDVVNVDDTLRIPDADEELPDRHGEYLASTQAAAPAATASVEYEPVYSQEYTPGAEAVYATDSAGNTYFAGYCTWYAKERRPDLPNMLGNGGQWAVNAAAQGFATGSTPKVGAIAETAGHVAYVESVNPDGTITISDMNGRAGFGNVGTQTVNPGNYTYIY